jgi:hypothetical protein
VRVHPGRRPARISVKTAEMAHAAWFGGLPGGRRVAAACCLADQTGPTATTFASAAMHTSLGEDLRVALVRYRDQAIAGRRCPEAAAVVIRAELPLEPVEFLHLLT